MGVFHTQDKLEEVRLEALSAKRNEMVKSRRLGVVEIS